MPLLNADPAPTPEVKVAPEAAAPASPTPAGNDTAGTPNAGAATPAAAAPDPSVALQAKMAEFEGKLSKLSEMEMTVTQREKAIKALEEKYPGLSSVGESLPEGITPALLSEALSKLKSGDATAFVKALLRDKWSPQTLMEWADNFDAEELTVEQRIERKFEATKKAEEERLATEKAAKDKKEADDKAAKDKADEEAANAEWKAKLTAASSYLGANKEKYPLTVRLDAHPRIDTERLVVQTTLKWISEKNAIPTEEQIFTAIEAEHREMLNLANPAPPAAENSLEKLERELNEMRAKEQAEPKSQSGVVPSRSYDDEARERMRTWERDATARGELSWGR